MRHSETLGELAAALASVQAQLPIVHKGNRATVPMKSGGKYTYTYADLSDVTAAVMPLLAANGLAFTCQPRPTERGYEIAGTLLHNSGEWTEASLPLSGSTPQEIGSSITYMRRYLLGSMTGVVTDDDDDATTAQRGKQSPVASEPVNVPRISDAQRKRMHTLVTELDVATEKKHPIIAYYIGREVGSSKDLTRPEAKVVIDGLVARQREITAADTPAAAINPHTGETA